MPEPDNASLVIREWVSKAESRGHQDINRMLRFAKRYVRVLIRTLPQPISNGYVRSFG